MARNEDRPRLEGSRGRAKGNRDDGDSTSRRSEHEGFVLIPSWVIQDGLLTPNELALYMVLLKYRNATTGIAFPGRATIATQTATSVKTVERTIPLLERKGVIAHKRRAKSARTPKVLDSNEYQVLVFPMERPRGSDKMTLPSDKLTLGVATGSRSTSRQVDAVTRSNELDARTRAAGGDEPPRAPAPDYWVDGEGRMPRSNEPDPCHEPSPVDLVQHFLVVYERRWREPYPAAGVPDLYLLSRCTIETRIAALAPEAEAIERGAMRFEPLSHAPEVVIS